MKHIRTMCSTSRRTVGARTKEFLKDFTEVFWRMPMEATTGGGRQRHHACRMLVACAKEVRGGRENRARDRSRGRGFDGELFALERQAKDVSVAERLALRQTQSAAVLAELRQKLLSWKEQLLPKHPMAEAVSYTLGQWQELRVFAKDGAVPIDNNVSEREMKRVVLIAKTRSS